MMPTIRRNVLFIFKLLKVFGFAIFTVENGKFVTKPRDLLFLAVNLLITLGVIFISFIFRNEILKAESEIVTFGNFMTFVTSGVITSLSMVLFFVLRHRTWRILVQLSKIDRKLNNVGFDDDYSPSVRILMSAFVSIMLLSIPVNTIFYSYDGSALKAALYFYAGFYFILSCVSVFTFISGIYLRLGSINKVCESILYYPSNIRIISNFKHQKDDNDLIRTLIIIYGKLVGVQHDINICYGFPAMIGLGLLFFYSIFTSFMAFKDFSNNGKLEDITFATVLYTLYLNVFSFANIFICSISESEAKKTLKISNSILKRSKDKTKVALLMSLNALIERNPLKFSCGLFEFDWKLVYGVSINRVIQPLNFHHEAHV